MGEAKNSDLRVSFDSRVKLKFLGSKVTTDAGLLAYRELDETLGLTEMGTDELTDLRLGNNKQHQLVPLLRQSIYSRLAGYEDVNDAERLSVDPAMRHVVGGRAAMADKRAASTSEVGRFETEIINANSNLTALMDLSGEWIDKVQQRKPPKQLILDLDSSVSETYGRQEGREMD
ncbi:MAG: transposase, partial [Planctomycetales bacterium]